MGKIGDRLRYFGNSAGSMNLERRMEDSRVEAGEGAQSGLAQGAPGSGMQV